MRAGLLCDDSALQQLSQATNDTVMIRDADHMYTGEEAKVAETIAKWADTLMQPAAGKAITPGKP